MKTSEVRLSFLNFFKSKGHTIVESSALVPHGDPTLMFTNAGMNQFKDCFLGADKRAYSRATTSQKVMRISGKHNDFENVGVTARHHTFFEMLGNFSFGDYFKKEAITFAWEYITEVLKLPKERLWVTIHDSDDEAKDLWLSETSISADRILKLGDEDNFWAMGESGPCGPCTEIHYYLGDINKEQTAEWFLKGDGTFLEIWNLVFMQYNRSEGKLNPLPKPSVDTGMGLERIAAVMQGKTSNYDIDLLRAIIAKAEVLSGYQYDGTSYEQKDLLNDKQYARDVAMRVLADHCRAMTFIVADGVLPSAEGRGYILRRVIRRAIRHGKVLEFKKPILTELCSTVIELMSEAYPEIKERKEQVLKVVDAEERKFHETLELGLGILNKEVAKVESGKLFPGKTAFALHDTYGFPLDLTEDALKAFKLKVDVEEFNNEMSTQRERARADRKSQKISYQAQSFNSAKTIFVGYDQIEAEGTLVELVQGEDDAVALVFDKTPFYAESGGQVGDSGQIQIGANHFEVLDTQKTPSGHILHHCRLLSGEISTALIGQKALLKVDIERRQKIKVHHSATHILHYALRTVLGGHVKQAGSRVDEASLRFDYNHFEPVNETQLTEIQKLVTEQVLANHEVNIKEMGIDAAKAAGAMALFGEKYGEVVRVVQIGPKSIELCGGTHVSSSGELGTVMIQSEGGIAAGVRRIECVAGLAANDVLLNERSDRNASLQLLKGEGESLTNRIEKLLAKNKELEKELDGYKAKLASGQATDLASKVKLMPSGLKVVLEVVEAQESEALRTMVDSLKVKLVSGIVALASKDGSLVVGVSNDLSKEYNAGKLVKEAASLAGGKGGGRADFAQAGGLSPDKLKLALDKIEQIISLS
jgi:alanyl-tRNA synthetase